AILFGLILAAGLIPLLICFPDRGVEEQSEQELQFLRVSRDPRRYVRPEEQTALLSPLPCAPRPRGPSATPPRLLMLVTSAPAHHERRQAIRETWAAAARTARLVFVLGRGARSRPLETLGLTDAYYKPDAQDAVPAQWAVRECPSARSCSMTDDDMLINTRGLVRALRALGGSGADGGANGRLGALDAAATGDSNAHEALPPIIFGSVLQLERPVRPGLAIR
ncbi:Beta-1,3-galactosyltransferase 4, partial [Gryllus bimaculatus]